MSEHPREHEQLLTALLAGELDPESDEVRSRINACARCREEWEEMSDTTDRLERVGHERRALLAGLETAAGAPGEERLLATLEQLANDEPKRRARPSGLLAVLAAAAVVLAVWLAWPYFGVAGQRDVPNWLGGAGLALQEPREGARSFERFAWSFDRPAASFTLRIFALQPGGRGDKLYEERGIQETTWTTPEELLSRLPATIEWEVEAFDEFFVSLDTTSVTASLVSR